VLVCVIPLPNVLVHPSAPAASSSSTLSPNVAPFLPKGSKTGRPKTRRWADEDLIDVSDAETTPASSAPYRDVVLRETQLPQPTWPRPAQTLTRASPSTSGHGGAVPVRQGAGRRWGKRRWPRPQLVHGMPARPVEGRIPAHQRLGRRGWASSPDADGWREILHRQATQPVPYSSVPPGSARGGRSASHRPLRHIPTDLHGKCFNCLSSAHRVATCKLPQRCLRCKGLRHVARDCK
jgi:hypothetical protein